MSENWKEMASGTKLDLPDPKPDQVLIGDIAHHLAMLCRFTGATKRFYSVAEHSMFVAHLVGLKGGGSREQMAGLLHDAHEMVVNDISRPAKLVICGPGYRKLTAKLDRIIFGKFNARWTPLVKACDDIMCVTEGSVLLPSGARNWSGEWPPINHDIADKIARDSNDAHRDPRCVRGMFLDMFLWLKRSLADAK